MSTAGSSSARRIAWRIVQYALALAFIVFAARTLLRQWHDASSAHLQLQLAPGWLALSSMIVLATYLLLVEIWRHVLARFGARVGRSTAARVWFVSNLGKYVPGKVWQLSSMATMLNRKGIPLSIAGGAAILVAVCNVVAGFVLVLAIGAPSLHALGERAEPVVLTATIVLLLGLLTAPFTVQWAARVFNYLSGRRLQMKVPARAVWESILGYVATWVLYGLAFELFAVAVVGHAGGSWIAYTATFTISYLVGYLWLPAPGGLGAREWAMSTLLVALKLGTPAEAATLTIASRIWLTILEIVPGLIYIVRRPR
jgi:uncharacterized membrane protein YbhN (UPF0104 family)